MALQLAKTKFGVTFNNTYHRVEQVIVTKSIVNFQVTAYHEQNGAILENASYQMAYDSAGTEPLTQAYTYLKTLPEYAGAIDV